MKKKLVKSALTLTSIALFTVASFASSTVHTSTLTFQGEHTGTTRYYEGNHISNDMVNYTTDNQNDDVHSDLVTLKGYN